MPVVDHDLDLGVPIEGHVGDRGAAVHRCQGAGARSQGGRESESAARSHQAVQRIDRQAGHRQVGDFIIIDVSGSDGQRGLFVYHARGHRCLYQEAGKSALLPGELHQTIDGVGPVFPNPEPHELVLEIGDEHRQLAKVVEVHGGVDGGGAIGLGIDERIRLVGDLGAGASPIYVADRQVISGAVARDGVPERVPRRDGQLALVPSDEPLAGIGHHRKLRQRPHAPGHGGRGALRGRTSRVSHDLHGISGQLHRPLATILIQLLILEPEGQVTIAIEHRIRDGSRRVTVVSDGPRPDVETREREPSRPVVVCCQRSHCDVDVSPWIRIGDRVPQDIASRQGDRDLPGGQDLGYRCRDQVVGQTTHGPRGLLSSDGRHCNIVGRLAELEAHRVTGLLSITDIDLILSNGEGEVTGTIEAAQGHIQVPSLAGIEVARAANQGVGEVVCPIALLAKTASLHHEKFLGESGDQIGEGVAR